MQGHNNYYGERTQNKNKAKFPGEAALVPPMGGSGRGIFLFPPCRRRIVHFHVVRDNRCLSKQVKDTKLK